jgi:hypothetical protein
MADIDYGRMKMKPRASKTSLSFLLVFCIWLTVGMTNVLPLSAQGVPAAVGGAAEYGFRSLLEAIPLPEISNFNFADKDEIKSATLGEGFRVFTIPPELIVNYNPGLAIEDMVMPTPIWFFPVLVSGEARALITVDLLDGQYQAVSLGGRGVAKEWAAASAKWPASAGYQNTFVRIYQATADFILVSNAVGTKMAPLQAGEMATGMGALGLYDPSAVIMALQEPVRANLESAR